MKKIVWLIIVISCLVITGCSKKQYEVKFIGLNGEIIESFKLYKDDVLIKEVEKVDLLQHYGGDIRVTTEELGIDYSGASSYRVEYSYEVLDNSYYYKISEKEN